MKLIQTTLQIAVLYGFYLTGEWLQMTFDLMIPGSMIGMGIFFSMLVTGLFPTRWFEEGTQMLLTHMPLMFLPVTVGVLNYLSFFQGKGLLLVIIVIMSTLIVMVSSAFIGQMVVIRKEKHQ